MCTIQCSIGTNAGPEVPRCVKNFVHLLSWPGAARKPLVSGVGLVRWILEPHFDAVGNSTLTASSTKAMRPAPGSSAEQILHGSVISSGRTILVARSSSTPRPISRDSKLAANGGLCTVMVD